MLLCYPSSEVLNALHCWWEVWVSLLLCLCMPLISNPFLVMGILIATRNAYLLLLIANWYPQYGIPELYSIVVSMLWYLEYLILLMSWTHLVLQHSHIPNLLIRTCYRGLRPKLNNPLVSVTLLQTFGLFLLASMKSYPPAYVFLQLAQLIFETSVVHSIFNLTTCRLQFLTLWLLLIFLCLLLSMIPSLLITVAYRLLAIIATSILLVRILYSLRLEMHL